MLQEKKTKTNIGVGLGVVCQLSSRILVHYGFISPDLGFVIYIIGVVVFVWGCMNYAEGKGASRLFGLFGLLSIIGLFGLFLLPDHHRQKT